MNRLRLLRLGFLAVGLLLIGQLFRIQVLSYDFYVALAEGQHDLFQHLFPERGKIYARDRQSDDQAFLLATNRTLNLLFAEPFRIKTPINTAQALAPILGIEEAELIGKLSSPTERYRVLARKLDDETREKIESLQLEGIGFTKEAFRYYPEGVTGGQMLGFLGESDKGKSGRYGIEGWFEKDLAGEQGYLESEKDSRGRVIAVGNRTLQPAKDGDDLVLTIDRTVQYVACKKLDEWVKKFNAQKGSVVILDPRTGGVIAMCNAPTFDPNDYGKVESVDVYNNTAIFEPYESGSVFKAITMAAGLDTGKITPSTIFDDPGEVKIGPFTIRNSDLKAHGRVDMTTVLTESLNTGLVDIVHRLGPQKFLAYVRDFGFGQKTGIELQTEAAGNIESLSRKGDIWSATASYGQGITVTVLQIASAYAAIANDGVLMKPYVVDEVRRADGTVEKRAPKSVRRVMSERAAELLSGMLVAVVENGHGKRAGVPGYWIAGKTGTAQIPRQDGGGYEVGQTIGSFAGFGPVDDPKFVMVVRIDRPEGVQFAESTAAPLFGDIAKFLLDYYQVPPTRN
ncbi:MAG: penicillin-binding protein 2 [Patescibacteria group bacterium]|nr:MAG: penicillin-binding protein 2 [Patescibacteria group bacterium]